MMNKMTTLHPPKKSLPLIIASNTLQFLNLYIQFFAFNHIPSCALAEVTGEGCCQKMKKSPAVGQLHSDQTLLFIQFFFAFTVFTIHPLLLRISLINKRMFHVFSQIKASCTQSNIFTYYTFINCFFRLDLSKLAPITVKVKFFTNFFTDESLFVLILFFLQLAEQFYRFHGPTERTSYNPIFIDLMLGPLHKTVQMKCITTFFLASCSCILFDNFHLTDRAQVLWFIIFFLLLFLHNDSGHPIPSAFEKIRDLVRVDDPIGNYISQLFVRIFVLEEQLAVCRQIKNLCEDINSVQAMKLFFGST